MTKEERYLELLKTVYKSYLRFNRAIHTQPLNQEEIDSSYVFLDSSMSEIFSEIGEEFITKK